MVDGAPYVVAVQERLILFKNLVSRNVHRIRVGALFGYEEEASENHPDVRFNLPRLLFHNETPVRWHREY